MSAVLPNPPNTSDELTSYAFVNLHDLAVKFSKQYSKICNNPKISDKKKQEAWEMMAITSNALYAAASLVSWKKANKIPGLTLYIDHT